MRNFAHSGPARRSRRLPFTAYAERVTDPPSASHREGFQPATLPEASRLLGVSESTVRRMVKAGRLEAERVLRPQGHVWMVMLPLPSTDPSAGSHRPSTREGEQPSSGDALATWTRSVLEPLVTELSLMRQANERQAEQLVGKEQEIGTIREERGRLTAELERARARLAELESPAESGRLEELARENGSLVERLAAQKRLREAAMAHAAELERRIEAATRPPDPSPLPPTPTPHIGVADELAALRAEHDRHTAELERADAMLARQVAEQAKISRQARRLQIALALAVAGALAVAAGLAPTWVR